MTNKDEKVVIIVMLEEETIDQLNKLASQRHQSIDEFVEWLISTFREDKS